MNAFAERYEDDLAFWSALRDDLREFIEEHRRAQDGARRELGLPSAEPSVDPERQPYELPASPRVRRRVRRRYGDSVQSEVELIARFRAEATRLGRHDADVAAIVAAYEEGGEHGADSRMVAVIADLDESRYVSSMFKLAAMMDEVAEEWLGN